MRKIVNVVLLICLCLLIVGIIISSKNSSKISKVLTVKNVYSTTFYDECIINVPIYFTEENKFNNLNNVDFVSLTSNNFSITCELLNIEDLGIRDYNKENYLCKLYEIKIPYKNDYHLKNCKLNIKSGNDSLSLDIGSVSLFYRNSLGDNKELTILESKVLGKNKFIEGLMIKLEAKETLVITDIIVDGISCFVDLNNVRQVNNSFNESNSIKDVISDYNSYTIQPNYTLEEIELNGELRILLPLKYIDKLNCSTLPVIIKYKVNGVEDEYVLDDFEYIKNFYEIIDLGGVVICNI